MLCFIVLVKCFLTSHHWKQFNWHLLQSRNAHESLSSFPEICGRTPVLVIFKGLNKLYLVIFVGELVAWTPVIHGKACFFPHQQQQKPFHTSMRHSSWREEQLLLFTEMTAPILLWESVERLDLILPFGGLYSKESSFSFFFWLKNLHCLWCNNSLIIQSAFQQERRTF